MLNLVLAALEQRLERAQADKSAKVHNLNLEGPQVGAVVAQSVDAAHAPVVDARGQRQPDAGLRGADLDRGIVEARVRPNLKFEGQRRVHAAPAQVHATGGKQRVALGAAFGKGGSHLRRVNAHHSIGRQCCV